MTKNLARFARKNTTFPLEKLAFGFPTFPLEKSTKIHPCKSTDNLTVGTRESVVWSYVIFLVVGYIRRSAKQYPEDIILLISNNVYRKERDHERIERVPAEIARAVMPLYLKYYHMTNSKLCDPSKWHQFLYEELNDGNTALAKALIQHKV